MTAWARSRAPMLIIGKLPVGAPDPVRNTLAGCRRTKEPNEGQFPGCVIGSPWQRIVRPRGWIRIPSRRFSPHKTSSTGLSVIVVPNRR